MILYFFSFKLLIRVSLLLTAETNKQNLTKKLIQNLTKKLIQKDCPVIRWHDGMTWCHPIMSFNANRLALNIEICRLQFILFGITLVSRVFHAWSQRGWTVKFCGRVQTTWGATHTVGSEDRLWGQINPVGAHACPVLANKRKCGKYYWELANILLQLAIDYSYI